jgi:hypothetical protein
MLAVTHVSRMGKQPVMVSPTAIDMKYPHFTIREE